MDLQEVGWWGMDWVVVAQGRGGWVGGGSVVNAMMNLRVS